MSNQLHTLAALAQRKICSLPIVQEARCSENLIIAGLLLWVALPDESMGM
jgi:hypothetical protein